MQDKQQIHGRKNINNDMTRKNRVGLTSELPAFNVKITKTAETTLDKPLTITTEEDTKYLVIMAITDGEIGKLNFDKVLENNTSKLMVEVGDKASPYEPYTGGKPSPSHDYPQQIKNVGKWNDGVKYFSAPNENVATVDEFKAWLIENPLKIAYETTNPEFVPLPQSEQDAVRNLKTYYPTTVIMVDGGELPVGIQATYKQVNK